MVIGLLEYRELRIGEYHLLVVEPEPGKYRLYVGRDRQRYCHYDTGQFEDLDRAARAAQSGFDPEPFRLFPVAPYSREDVLEHAPDAVADLTGQRSTQR